MYANSGKLEFEHLVKAAVNPASPTKLLYKNVLESLNKSYLLNIIVQIATGVDPCFINTRATRGA